LYIQLFYKNTCCEVETITKMFIAHNLPSYCLEKSHKNLEI